MSVDGALGVLGGLGHGQHLVGDGQALVGVVGQPDCPVEADEGVAQRGGVVQLAGHVNRLLAQGSPLLLAVAVAAPGAGKPREQPHPKPVVGPAQHHEGVLQERDQVRVVADARPEEPATVAEHRPRQRLGRSLPAGELRRLEVGLPGCRQVPCPCLRLAQAKEHLDTPFRIARRVQLEHRKAHPVQACRLLVGKRSQSQVAGVARVLDRQLRRRAMPLNRHPSRSRARPRRSDGRARPGTPPAPDRTAPAGCRRCADEGSLDVREAARRRASRE